MEPCRERRKTVEPVPDWSSLPEELLVEIAKLVIKSAYLEDFMAFAGVCTSWRSASRDDECAKLVKSWPMLPLLMLADKEDGSEEEREFYSLSKKKVCMRLSIPHGKGKKLFLESRFGWFVTVRMDPGPEPDELLNPFTGARFSLPTDKALFEIEMGFNGMCRSVLSADPSCTSDFVLVLVTELHWLCWRPGDLKWTEIKCGSVCFIDAIYCNRDGNFYAITDPVKCFILAWDPAGPPDAQAKGLRRIHADSRPYLAESSAGDLLLIIRRHPNEYTVYQIDVDKEETVGSCLNGAFFVGRYSASLSIVPAPDASMSSSIFFTHIIDTSEMERKLVSYNVRDGSVQRLYLGAPVNYGFTDFWVAPSSIPFTRLLRSATNKLTAS